MLMSTSVQLALTIATPMHHAQTMTVDSHAHAMLGTTETEYHAQISTNALPARTTVIRTLLVPTMMADLLVHVTPATPVMV